jgi:hypothetical protein
VENETHSTQRKENTEVRGGRAVMSPAGGPARRNFVQARVNFEIITHSGFRGRIKIKNENSICIIFDL